MHSFNIDIEVVRTCEQNTPVLKKGFEVLLLVKKAQFKRRNIISRLQLGFFLSNESRGLLENDIDTLDRVIERLIIFYKKTQKNGTDI